MPGLFCLSVWLRTFAMWYAMARYANPCETLVLTLLKGSKTRKQTLIRSKTMS